MLTRERSRFKLRSQGRSRLGSRLLWLPAHAGENVRVGFTGRALQFRIFPLILRMNCMPNLDVRPLGDYGMAYRLR
jgi:hypothetical protein